MTNHAQPVLTVRKAEQRGRADFGWLDSRHSFSFGDYYDPAHMGFRALRVINEDRVTGGAGFPTHPHRDMEIFSYVLDGALAHRDSLGNERILRPGQVQLMSAGSGVTHSEYNPDPDTATHFLQIWIQPRAKGLPPGYTEWHPDPARADEAKVLIISPDGRDGSATIQQDACVYRIRLTAGSAATHHLPEGRGLWLQVMRGRVSLQGIALVAGDGAASESPGTFTIAADESAEALLFDLA
ncbi:MAG TPA: pirin family protein [Kiritimatiellia bacterium]|nr:pirin family protein [Kiritimatiellia bacterium]HMP00174.1 pirin family protein [Kiritimatiellia bacterium]HMP96801.1 pirin family protein [Kiritimatiellia bacterium]